MGILRVLIALLVLGLLIMVHEFGHFSIASLFKVDVKEFWIFIGPKIFSWKGKKTTYSFRLLPLGGLVMMDDDSLNEKAWWKRALIIIAGPVFNGLIAMIMVVILTFCQGYSSNYLDIQDEQSPAYAAGLRTGDKLVEANGFGVSNTMDYSIAQYISHEEGMDYVVERGDDEITVHVDPETIKNNIIGVVMKSGGDDNVSLTIDSVNDDSPAQKAGLQGGDKIIAVNGKNISSFSRFKDILAQNGEAELNLTIRREEKEISVKVTPTVMEGKYVGIGFMEGEKSLGAVTSYSAGYCYSIIKSTFYSLKWLFTGDVGVKDMSGPVGMVATMSDVMSQGDTVNEVIMYLLYLAAMISLSLGAFNMIPFPGLDGSKFLIIIVETIFRRKLKPSVENIISLIGMGLLLLMMVVFTFNDVMKLFS